PRLLSGSVFQPFAASAVTSSRGDAVSRAATPVNFTGRASSNVNELVGRKLSGSSSRSTPSGASKRPNTNDQRVALAGVQLTIRLSISVEVAPLSAAVVNCPKQYASLAGLERLTAV